MSQMRMKKPEFLFSKNIDVELETRLLSKRKFSVFSISTKIIAKDEFTDLL